jgi:GDSL-like Lipase/Acylhydrolase family/N-terminus of Esterase_SGNH_hydro-type
MNTPLKPVRTDSSISWFDLRQLGVEGRGWNDTKSFYDRLPAKAEGRVREPVWNLSRHSAGMHVRFVSDATVLRARWALKLPALGLPNMAATGVSGLDLYVRTNGGSWRWLAVGIPEARTNSNVLVENLAPGKREYLLYLPIYNELDFVEIGIPQTANIEPAGPWGPGPRKPMAFYGTSIVHGLCASRPGMTHSAILGRKFNYPVLNLGFSGNGKMEPEMADLFAELDPSVYVLDCLPNMVDSEVRERAEPFVRRLRAARPETPVVLVEDRTMQDGFLVTTRNPHHQAVRAGLKTAYERLKKSGVQDLHYISGEQLLGNDGEGTVDASHPTDLGYTRQAEIFAPTLGPLLQAR